MQWRRPNYHPPAPVDAEGLIMIYKLTFLLNCVPVAPNNTLDQQCCQPGTEKQMHHWKAKVLVWIKDNS